MYVARRGVSADGVGIGATEVAPVTSAAVAAAWQSYQVQDLRGRRFSAFGRAVDTILLLPVFRPAGRKPGNKE